MKLFTPFTIPQKDNCDLCRIKTNKRKEVENPLLDQLFKFLYMDRFDFVFDWVGLIHLKLGVFITDFRYHYRLIITALTIKYPILAHTSRHVIFP